VSVCVCGDRYIYLQTVLFHVITSEHRGRPIGARMLISAKVMKAAHRIRGNGRRHLTTAAHYLADCRLAQRRQVRVESSGADWPSEIDGAYSQQALLHEIMWEHGHTVVGSKIGCTTAVMQEYLDVPHPCSGGIYDSRLWRQHVAEEPVKVPAGNILSA
jgi:hypothetical protein